MYEDNEEDISYHKVSLTVLQAGTTAAGQISMGDASQDQDDSQKTPTPIRKPVRERVELPKTEDALPKLFEGMMRQSHDARPAASAPDFEGHSPFRNSSRGHVDRLQLLPGDYFDRYDLELAKKAEKVSIIGTGGSGTVVFVGRSC